MKEPTLPRQSLAGKFPEFPTTTYTINIPYVYTWTINIPNISAIPQWIAEILLYIIGWGGAYFEYFFKYISVLIINTGDIIINDGLNIFNEIIKTTEKITAPLGIFSIPITTLIMGILFVVVIFAVWGIIKGVETVVEALA